MATPEVTTTETGEGAAQALKTILESGQTPLKIVTGRQDTVGFKIEPGGIVAHEGASVLFICG